MDRITLAKATSVGHAPAWDETVVDGNFEAKDCAVIFKRAGRRLTVATISRVFAESAD